MNFLFRVNNEPQQRQLTNNFVNQIKDVLRSQLCELCFKNVSTKIAFVSGSKVKFTCNYCQITAVNDKIQNLGQENLIQNQKLASVLTQKLISYQKSLTQPSQQEKQIQKQREIYIKNKNQLIDKIKSQYNNIKSSGSQKLKELQKQSQKQNSILIFDELNRLSKEKKPSIEEIKTLLLKRSLVNQNGLHFIDQNNLNSHNKKIKERFNILKEETKIKLKEIDDLTKMIEQIQV